MSEERVCPKCQGKKRIQKPDGTIQPCWDCLAAGDMDQHSKRLPDHDVKL